MYKAKESKTVKVMGSLSTPFKNTSAMAMLAEQRSVLSDISERSGTSGLPRRSNSSRPLKSSTYEDNFNFAFSFYQPMIDYLDKKDDGGGGSSTRNRNEPLPRLRFLEEQSLRQKSGSSKEVDGSTSLNTSKSPSMIRSYTERDLKTLIAQANSKENSKRTVADEVSGGGDDGSSGISNRMSRAKQYGYGGGGSGATRGHSRAVTFTDNRSGGQEMSSRLPSSSSSSTFLLSSSSSPSGVKLGVSKSTLSRSASDITKAYNYCNSSSNTSNNTTPTPASQYSLTKASIKASVLSKSVAVDEISCKLAESKRRLAEEKERESRCKTRMLFPSGDRYNAEEDDDDEHDSRSRFTLQRSHSFGAFTKRAKKVVEDQMAFNAVVQQRNSGGGSGAKGNFPLVARSISSEVGTAGSTSITELHSPVSFQRSTSNISRSGSRRDSVGNNGKNVRFSCSTKTSKMEDTSKSSSGDNNKITSDDASSLSPSSSASSSAREVRVSVTFDENREADAEYWKDLW